MSKPIIFVVTPLKPTPSDPGCDAGLRDALAANLRFAENTCRAIALAGGAPFAPHLLYTRFLDDSHPSERQIGIDCGLRIMEAADEVWARLPSWRKELSDGMIQEIEAARLLRASSHIYRRPDVVLITDDNHFERELARLRKL
jgi:hypothetical protein